MPGWHPVTTRSPEAGPVPAAGSGSIGFSNHGGPVIGCPQIYAGFWGQQWYRDAGYQALAGQIAQFLGDLTNSTFFNVLSQYGAGGGAGVAGAFFQSHTLPITGQLSDQDVQNWTQILIDTGNLPPASPPGSLGTIVFMIFLDETIGVNAPTLDGGISLCFPDAAQPYTPADFGYHNFFNTSAGNPMYYGVVACVSDSCLQESCADDSYCALHLSQSQQQRMTQVASHELAEICTDPQLNAWYSSALGEIGDICNGESDTVTVQGRTWTVQKLYSLATGNSTNGGTICIASSPQPLAMAAGAGFVNLAGIAGRRPGELERILPLPMLHVDPEARAAQINKRQLRRYINRIISPLRPAHLPAGLPAMLREAAAMLEEPHGGTPPGQAASPPQGVSARGVPTTKR
jgi:hypothetical protein